MDKNRPSELEDGIWSRQFELRKIAMTVARSAQRQGTLAASARVITIVLGALAATNGAATALFGENDMTTIVVYTLIGLIITAVAGLDAAFKFENKASELKLLAAQCQATIWQIGSELEKVADITEPQAKGSAVLLLSEIQNKSLSDIQTKAAQLGVNTTLVLQLSRRESTSQS